jgi:MFS family permease
VSGFGSVLGPLIGASLMARFGIDGVFYFMAVVAVLLAVVAGAGALTAMAPQHLQRPFEILAPQAASLAHDSLDLSKEHLQDPVVINPEGR